MNMVHRKSALSLKEEIYNYIKENIFLGRLLPNEKITEEPIASCFGVSRTPVREVLTQMASEGMIIKIPRKGFYVRKTTPEEKIETYEVIACLDILCAEKAMNHLDENDILKLKETVAKMEVAIQYHNFSDYIKSQIDFHNIYIEKCGNKVLINTINGILNNTVDKTFTFEHLDDHSFELLAKSNQEHKLIITCFIEKNKTKLSEIIMEHWKD